MIRHIAAAALGGVLTHGVHLLHDTLTASDYAALTARLMAEEGFRALPYRDSRGILTVGYGRNLTVPFTHDEGRYLLASSLDRNAATFIKAWPPFDDMPHEVRAALLDAAFELGPDGVLGFKKMLAHAAAGEWEAAAKEAISSKWDAETPTRAHRLAEVFRAQL